MQFNYEPSSDQHHENDNSNLEPFEAWYECFFADVSPQSLGNSDSHTDTSTEGQDEQTSEKVKSIEALREDMNQKLAEYSDYLRYLLPFLRPGVLSVNECLMALRELKETAKGRELLDTDPNAIVEITNGLKTLDTNLKLAKYMLLLAKGNGQQERKDQVDRDFHKSLKADIENLLKQVEPYKESDGAVEILSKISKLNELAKSIRSDFVTRKDLELDLIEIGRPDTPYLTNQSVMTNNRRISVDQKISHSLLNLINGVEETRRDVDDFIRARA